MARFRKSDSLGFLHGNLDNIYIQSLTEIGILGSIVVYGFLFYLIYNLYLELIKRKSKKHDKLKSFNRFSFVMINIFPFLPTGSLFGSFNSICIYYSIVLYFSNFDINHNVK